MTHALLNGRFVPLEEALVSVFDRSFLYGDGVFETMRVLHGNPFRWDEHFDRLCAAAAFLGIALPERSTELRGQASELIERNKAPDSVLRIHLSRGTGSRGYSPHGANAPTRVLTSHPPPAPAAGGPAAWRVIVCPWRIAESDALRRFKTANRLLNVMARKAADEAGADEALMLDPHGEVCAAAAANLFWIEQGRLLTPPAARGIRAGVTREVMFELGTQAGEPVREDSCTLDRLERAEAVFLTQSVEGVAWVSSVNGTAMRGRDLVARWQTAYQQVLESETRRA